VIATLDMSWHPTDTSVTTLMNVSEILTTVLRDV
jgi:hypothetical protein